MKRLLYTLFLLLVVNSSRGQDFHLSMYDSGPLFLNPAMTGVFDGKWRVHAQQRTQWRTVNFKPYLTSHLSFDMPKGKWGFGASIVNLRAGIGNYNALQAVASLAYTVSVDRKKNHNLSFGLQGGVTQKSVEYQLHTFNNQYVTTNGGGFDSNLSSGEDFAAQSLLLPQLNAGFLYFFAKQQSKLNPFLGISAFNLLEPNESFFNNNESHPMRFYGHVGTRINLTETFYLIPKALYMQQVNATEITGAVDASYFFKEAQFYLLAGAVYRLEDAAIISLGAKKDGLTGRISYDINTSSLNPSSNGRGGFEISITYVRENAKGKSQKICPRL